MKNRSPYPHMANRVLLAVTTVVGSLLAHAALLTGTLSFYSALSAVPSAPVSFALIVALPWAVSLVALALFIRYTRASMVWQALMLALLAACALGQLLLTPLWSCLASRSFCL
jgi:hypothetical protein